MFSNNLMQSLLLYVLKLSHGVVPALHHREQAYLYTFLLNIIRKLQDHQNKSSDMKTIHHEHHSEPASHYNCCSTSQSSMITKPEAAT
jgi:hypothetical protein